MEATRRSRVLGAIPEETLAAIYQPFGFLQSETLDSIEPVLATGNGGADGSANHDKTAELHASGVAPARVDSP